MLDRERVIAFTLTPRENPSVLCRASIGLALAKVSVLSFFLFWLGGRRAQRSQACTAVLKGLRLEQGRGKCYQAVRERAPYRQCFRSCSSVSQLLNPNGPVSWLCPSLFCRATHISFLYWLHSFRYLNDCLTAIAFVIRYFGPLICNKWLQRPLAVV